MWNIQIVQSGSKEINVRKILTVKVATYAVSKRKPEKIQACRDSNRVLCDTSALLHTNQLS